MLKNILKVNRPDFIELTTETKTVTAKWENDDYNLDDINVKLNPDNEYLAIFLTAQTSKVKWIKLRWNNLSWDKNVRFLGDAWERGYGDMEWKGMNPNRFMPWYFCAKSEAKSICSIVFSIFSWFIYFDFSKNSGLYYSKNIIL